LEAEGEEKSEEGAGDLTPRSWSSCCRRNLRNGVFYVAAIVTAKADLGLEDCVPVVVVVVQAIVLHLPTALTILFAGGAVVTKVIYVCSATVAPNYLCGVVSIGINLDEVFLQHPTTVILAAWNHSVLGGKVVTEWHIWDLPHLPVQPILLVAAAVAFNAFWTGGISWLSVSW